MYHFIACSNVKCEFCISLLTRTSIKKVKNAHYKTLFKSQNKKIYRQSNLPVVRLLAPIVVRGAYLRILPLDRRWLFSLVPSELLRPSDNCCSEKTDVDIVDAVESPRRLNVPPLDDVVADESLRENIE